MEAETLDNLSFDNDGRIKVDVSQRSGFNVNNTSES